MSRTWNIKGRRTVGGVMTEVTLATVHDPEYHGEWMEPDYLTVTVRSAVPIDFAFSDWIIYRGAKYTLATDPNVIKKARSGTYGEGFTYDNIKFWGRSYSLKHTEFHDIVLADNDLTYTDMSRFSFYAASIEDLADRLQANLNRNPPDNEPWYVMTPNKTRTLQRNGQAPLPWDTYYASLSGDTDYTQGSATLGEKDVNVSVEDQGCLDILKKSYTDFGLSFFVKGQMVVIGGDAIMPDTIFRYGKGLGLYEIERTGDDNQEVVTRAYGYGSDQNLPLNYYANIGKKVRFTLQYKTTRAISLQNPTLVLWTDIPWSSTLKNAFGSSGNVILTYNGYSAAFTAYAQTYTYGDEAHDDSHGLDHVTEYLTFNSLSGTGYEDATALYNALPANPDGADVYLTGVDINMFPEEYIELPTGYDYPAALSVNRLMLPGFPESSLNAWLGSCASDPSSDRTEWGGLSRTDAQLLLQRYTFSTDKESPWIQSKNAGTSIGIREGSVYFDGSSQKEIYPTIENTVSNVVHSAQTVYDNGYLSEGSNIQFFVAVYRGSGYMDWRNAYDTAPDKDDVYLEMKSGFCTGRKFKVVKVEEDTYEQDGTLLWKLTCEREKDSSLSRYFPYYDNDVNWYCQVLSGDTFVVTGIQMPDEYIIAASVKLLIATCGWLDRRDHMRYTYTPKIDELYMQRQDDASDSSEEAEPSMHDTLCAGMKFQFEDAADLGIERYGSASLFIDVLTIKEDGNNGIPTYEVVLREEKEKGFKEEIYDSIADLKANPPVQVVERPNRTLEYIEYDSWSANGKYYHEAINPDEDRLETSRVWHKGCLWECRRTLTTEEPWFSSADWVCLRANNISLGFYTNTEPPVPIYGLSVRPQHIDETVKPYLLLGQEDISSEVTAWRWERESNYTALDEAWKNSMHTNPENTDAGNTSPLKSVTRVLHITNADMPSGWSDNGGQVGFKCTATFPFGTNENAEIINQINII